MTERIIGQRSTSATEAKTVDVSEKVIYILRHGESTANIAGIHGEIFATLTPKGVIQARQRAKDLQHISFDAVWTSTMGRTTETAQAFGYLTRPHEGFNERSFGCLEKEPGQIQLGAFKKYLDSLPRLQRGHIRFVSDMESDLDAYMRFSQTLREVATEEKKQTILIVSHQNVMRTFLEYASLLAIPQGGIENCGYVRLGFKNSVFTLLDRVGVKHK